MLSMASCNTVMCGLERTIEENLSQFVDLGYDRFVFYCHFYVFFLGYFWFVFQLSMQQVFNEEF